MKELGYGKGYQYAHNHDDAVVTQSHLPERIADTVYYRPKDSGYEKTIKERQTWLKTQKTGKGKSQK
jgi:putative ATPase